MLVLLLLNLLLQVMMRMMKLLQPLLLSFQELLNLVKVTMRMTLIWIFLHSVECVECILRVCRMDKNINNE